MRGLVLAAALVAAGCGRPVDLMTGLQVTIAASGWLDRGVVDGKNKIVPVVAVQLKNVSEQALPMLQVNALFRRIGNDAELGSGFTSASGSSGLAPGAATSTLTLASQQGYTGTDASADLLGNSHFVDATVELFAKYGSGRWTRIGSYPVTRKLLKP